MKNYFMMLSLVLLLACKKESDGIPEHLVAEIIPENAEAAAIETVEFSGYTWKVKNSRRSKMGPGPNFWGSKNVWVDSNGYLHLQIKRDSATGKWGCAEIATVQKFKYGTFQFWVEGSIDKLDPNVVFGLFNYSGNDGFDEMDMEFARWGNASNPVLTYTVWPAQQGNGNFSYTENFSIRSTYTTHRFSRTDSSVSFQSLQGHTNDDSDVITTAECVSPPNSISKLTMPVYMNLWLFQGNQPANGKNVEIIIHRFTYTP